MIIQNGSQEHMLLAAKTNFPDVQKMEKNGCLLFCVLCVHVNFHEKKKLLCPVCEKTILILQEMLLRALSCFKKCLWE